MERSSQESLETEAINLIESWEKLAEEVQMAIADKSYEGFRKTFAKADECSQKIQFLMRQGHTEPFKKHEERMCKIIKLWDKIAKEQIAPWKDETAEKIKGLKKQSKVNNKINKAYNYMKIAGASVNIKKG
jgi:DNA gyrase/topoisomerase IV subunit B